MILQLNKPIQRLILSILAIGVPIATAEQPIGKNFPICEADQNPLLLEGSTELAEFLTRKTHATSVLVVQDGKVIFSFGDTSEVSYIASCRKSVLSILYGNYVAIGKIDLESTLAELKIDDVQGLTDKEKQATVLDVISSRSGVFHPASNSGDNLKDAPFRGSVLPGAYFLYSNWDFNVAGTIFEQETGKSIYESLRDDLAKPLLFQDFDFARHRRQGDSKKSKHLAYHMHLSTRDKAKIGYLMLKNGEWNGQQLFPKEWIKKITRVRTPVTKMNPAWRQQKEFGFGMMWWVWDGERISNELEGAYTASGYFGQYLTVIPKRNPGDLLQNER